MKSDRMRTKRKQVLLSFLHIFQQYSFTSFLPNPIAPIQISIFHEIERYKDGNAVYPLYPLF